MIKLRLAVVNTQSPLYLGGVERRILEVAKRLQGKVETTVYSGSKGALKTPTSVEGVNLVPFWSTDRIFPLDNWTFNQTLARNASKIEADVYEAHTASGYGLLNALWKKSIDRPFIETVHGVLADEYAQAQLSGGLTLRGRVANYFMGQLAAHEKEMAEKATLVVTISAYSKEKIERFYSIKPEKIRIAPNGVDSERFTPIGDCLDLKRWLNIGERKMVLFVGRLIPRKGLNYLIDAAKLMAKENSQTLFVIVGDGPLRNSLSQKVQKQATLSGSFAFLGDVSEEDLPALYRCADVFAFPSLQEGQGIALLEAQSSCKPVVSFDSSGVREAVLDGESGLLVKRDSGALAEALLRLLSDSSLRQKMGQRGREFVVKNLSWDVCADRMFSVYGEAVSLSGKR
jgi:glycosyltransferase involved in cell wall biosynthesis